MKKTKYLCYLLVGLTLISTLVGLFASNGNSRFSVENIYGETVELYGDGIYKYDSVLKAGGNKGTDFVMLVVTILFAFLTAKMEKSARVRFLHAGLLISLLYYSACMVFGVTFNQLFLIYILQFSSALFATVFFLGRLLLENNLPQELSNKSLKGTAVFLIICGISVLMWLQFILPALLSRKPLPNIEVYTTEPTFVLDLAIILPVYVGCGVALFKKKRIGYKLTSILLTFITIVGVIVIGQNLFQSSIGVTIPIEQLFGLVISFAVLGTVATVLNIKFLRNIK